MEEAIRRKPLIDGDLIIYEAGFACETGWGGIPPFEYALQTLEKRLGDIAYEAAETEEFSIYLTGKTNFRNFIAKRCPYKVRAGNKPYHYKNYTAYIKSMYDWKLIEGLEADDLLSIAQTENPDGVIACSRDKDAKGVPGWLYSWELGNQPSFGPANIDHVGGVQLSPKRDKIVGTGGLFFYSQCLTGDRVDTIMGLPNCGAVKAAKLLEGVTSLDSAYEIVLSAYKEVYAGAAEVELLEQGRLLHMTREFKEGHALLWNLPGSGYKEWIDVKTGTIERAS